MVNVVSADTRPWNALPENIKQLTTLSSFTRHLKHISLNWHTTDVIVHALVLMTLLSTNDLLVMFYSCVYYKCNICVYLIVMFK